MIATISEMKDKQEKYDLIICVCVVVWYSTNAFLVCNKRADGGLKRR